MVDEHTVTRAEAELRITWGDVEIKKLEIAEVDLLVNRLSMRRDRINQVIKLAERAKATVDAQPINEQKERAPVNETEPRERSRLLRLRRSRLPNLARQPQATVAG